MRGRDVVHWGGDQVRIGPWRADSGVALVATMPERPPLSAAGVRHCLSILAHRGYRAAVTAALEPREVQGFLGAGFTVKERLHLLGRALDDLPPQPAASLRRARRRDRAAVLALDARSFMPFWRLDEGALEDALGATPTTRFRVADDPGVAGYAITGCAAHRGYVQRLAVDPDHQGHGLGAALLLDGLHWCRHRGASHAVVNTQEGNDTALALYEGFGFTRRPGGLAVLETEL